ncbi:hypothetical protein BVX98_04965 [bacterium F11]|nr:hypothetical protein BVX98_04965 [bacterium F11]
MIDRTLNYGRPVIKKFLESIPPFQTVVDIGAGGGEDLGLAVEVAPETKVHAIELEKTFVEQLKNRKWSVHEINIERDAFPFEKESLDVVMANQILEHVKEVFWIFDQISRVLKVGGHFILGVPNLASFHNRILLLLGQQPTSIRVSSAHVRGYTKPGILTFLSEAAPGVYRLKKSGGGNFYPFPGFLAKPLAKVFPNMAVGCFLLFEKVGEYQGQFLDFAAPGKLQTNYFVGNGIGTGSLR